MNYQFTRDPLGAPVARFEMGAESFSHWFSEEIGSDMSKIMQMHDAIAKLQNEQIREYTLQGKEFSLSLDKYEVELKANMVEGAEPEDLPEGTELYDQESISGCGLEDFAIVLQSWRDFVS